MARHGSSIKTQRLVFIFFFILAMLVSMRTLTKATPRDKNGRFVKENLSDVKFYYNVPEPKKIKAQTKPKSKWADRLMFAGIVFLAAYLGAQLGVSAGS